MLGLQDNADVAQLVERRLPKPRQARSGAKGRDRYRALLADACRGFDWLNPADTGGWGKPRDERSGVVVAS